MKLLIIVGLVACSVGAAWACTSTRVSGTKAPTNFCAGDLIFQDEFDYFDHSKWSHEYSLFGGFNWEFQFYSDDVRNSYVDNGVMHLRPTYTYQDLFNGREESLWDQKITIPGNICTQSGDHGCERTGERPNNILNPFRSAKIQTINSFSLAYGEIQVRARLPLGKWLWPAIWMMPKHSVYGGWPRSGEIDIMESRGNAYMPQNGVNIGVEQFGSTLHFGPSTDQNAWYTAHNVYQRPPGQGLDGAFHTYTVRWTPEGLRFLFDGAEFLNVAVGAGFWARGGFGGQNIWSTPMAPFDQEFYLMINLAVGGTNGYMPDNIDDPASKPWRNNSPRAAADMWEARRDWEPTWNEGGASGSHLEVDWVRIYAV